MSNLTLSRTKSKNLIADPWRSQIKWHNWWGGYNPRVHV